MQTHAIGRPSWTQGLDLGTVTFRYEPAAVEALIHWGRTFRDRPLSELGPAPREGPLAEVAARTREVLKEGPGLCLWRGFPHEALDAEEVTRAYAVLGLGLGSLAPQNLQAELLTHVRDTGADPNAIETRLYTTRAAQDFHTDGADVIGLLCLRPAAQGGESLVASSEAIVAELARTDPELYPVLFEPFPWHYQEPGLDPFFFLRPICTVQGGRLNTFFIPWYLRRSQLLPEAPRLTPAQLRVIERLEILANDPRFAVSMNFAPGDVQWLKNAAVLHRRNAYRDPAPPALGRHLLRLWVSAPDFDDGDPELRRGLTLEDR
ncbi:MAG: TauD/TfdA family dioxygenase [Deltaproteobacteria bacterium]|nr:TauD/TfdA family dioxygenase [Deltaproteobacteria bacterium]